MTENTFTEIKDTIILFSAQMFSFAIITINCRAVAQANYFWSIVSDLIIAALSYFVVRKIMKSKDSIYQWVGFTIGSAVGTLIGIWLSKLILGN